MERDTKSEEKCNGACTHAKSYHLVKVIGDPEGNLGCCKVDCACMKFVPKPEVKA